MNIDIEENLSIGLSGLKKYKKNKFLSNLCILDPYYIKIYSFGSIYAEDIKIGVFSNFSIIKNRNQNKCKNFF